MVKNRIARFASAIFVVLFVIFAPAQSASAGVDDFKFESMHADYRLSLGQNDIPQLQVTETITADFPDADQNRGIRRLIPDEYKGHGLATEVTSVKDENGKPRDFSLESQNGFVILVSKHADGRFVHGRQTYVISYNQKWVIGSFGATDEFYWDVNGTGWSQPFDSVTASVTVLPELANILNVADISCYSGRQESKNACDSAKLTNQKDSVRVDFTSQNLAAGESLTIDLPFKPGVANTGNVSRVTGTPVFVLFLMFAAGIVVVLIWDIFYRVRVIGGRGMRKFVTAQYEGPKSPWIGVVASVTGSRHWQTATLVQAAVLGYLTISNDKDLWTLTRTNKKVQEPELEAMLEGLFAGDGTTVAFGKEVDDAESKRIVGLFNETMAKSAKEAVDLGYYSGFAFKQALLGWLALAIAVSGMIWTGLLLDDVVDAGFAALPLMLGAVATIAHFLILLSKRLPTQPGVDLKVYMEGLREYIELVDKDRLAFLQSPTGAARQKGRLGESEILKLYEQALPWAILLGLEAQWSKVLATYYTSERQPTWIPLSLVGELGNSALNQAIAQSLAVSSSSGSDGGGSAGGGGGGGGGGGV